MPFPLSPPPSQHQIERLLGSLAGVVSARVLLDYEGRIRELHVLATPDLHPKQVVRNVESALSAGLGVEVDRRVVSVAQIEGSQEHRPSSEAVPDAGPAAVADAGRVVLVDFDCTRANTQRSRCTVTLERGGVRYSGTAEGADTLQGRAEAAAEAVLHAVGGMPGGAALGLEGARVVETEGRSYVLVAVRVMDQRPPLPLSGAASMDRAPEEAAIMAALQATNRWSTGDR